MKKVFNEIVAWQYDGCTAIGVLYDWNEYISVAVNYKMDSKISEGDLWWMDDIHKDEGTEIRPANDLEIKTLLDALDKRKVSYKYDENTREIRIYDVYPTVWMRVKRWFISLCKKK